MEQVSHTTTPEENRQRDREERRWNQNPHGDRFGGRLQPASWTPLHLQILLHYYTSPNEMTNSNAPAVLAYTEDLVAEGLIAKVVAGWPAKNAFLRRPGYNHCWKLTDRGEAHVKALTKAALPPLTNICQEVHLHNPVPDAPNPVPVRLPACDRAEYLPVSIPETDGGMITRIEGVFHMLSDKIAGSDDYEQFLICFPSREGLGFTLKRTIPASLATDVIDGVFVEQQEAHPFLAWNLTDKQWERALNLLSEHDQRRARVARIASEKGRLLCPSRPADYATAVAIRRRPPFPKRQSEDNQP